MATAGLRRSAPWIVLGALSSVGLLGVLAGSRTALLLVPVIVVGAFLVWQLEPQGEFYAALIGLAVLPLTLAVRTQLCPGWDRPARCSEPFNPIVFLLAAGLMLAAGSAAALRSGRPTASR